MAGWCRRRAYSIAYRFRGFTFRTVYQKYGLFVEAISQMSNAPAASMADQFSGSESGLRFDQVYFSVAYAINEDFGQVGIRYDRMEGCQRA